jgi:hypothetical protein
MCREIVPSSIHEARLVTAGRKSKKKEHAVGAIRVGNRKFSGSKEPRKLEDQSITLRSAHSSFGSLPDRVLQQPDFTQLEISKKIDIIGESYQLTVVKLSRSFNNSSAFGCGQDPLDAARSLRGRSDKAST